VRIVQLNLAADRTLGDPDSLLESYHTLTGWSEALASAGAAVRVIQRFSSDGRLTRAGVNYEFVADGRPGVPSPWSRFSRVAEAIDRAAPDAIHINGLMFPGMLRRVRRTHPRAAIVVQDHSGSLPRSHLQPLGALRSLRWRRAFQEADACSVTARDLVTRWHPFGLPRDMRVLEIPEASTRLTPVDRREARAHTGIRGAPAVLWVGRLDRNKDPLTMLAGLERALPLLPEARVWMIAPLGGLREQVERRIAADAALRTRVQVIGPVTHSEMAAYCSSADVFVSASHHEGSGYALLEAMACGVVPCVTDIPAFRALTGGCAALWPVGDAAAFARALCSLAASDLAERRQAVARRFDTALTWHAIGRQTLAAYEALVAVRRTGQ
jgi:glycosyltransferase involved in cell wall biosynthesis